LRSVTKRFGRYAKPSLPWNEATSMPRRRRVSGLRRSDSEPATLEAEDCGISIDASDCTEELRDPIPCAVDPAAADDDDDDDEDEEDDDWLKTAPSATSLPIAWLR
jgi:hypothetical protein